MKVRFYQIIQIISCKDIHLVHTLFTLIVWTIHKQDCLCSLFVVARLETLL